jgi:hypothetical protein
VNPTIKEPALKRHKVVTIGATLIMSLAVMNGAAIALRLAEPGVPGQPLASGLLSGSDPHGVIHCQAAAELFIDPSLRPGSAPGGIVITPNGPHYAGPGHGLCAQIYTGFTGQQP